MSRQEDFIEAGIQYRFEQGKPMAISGGYFSEMTREMNRILSAISTSTGVKQLTRSDYDNI